MSFLAEMARVAARATLAGVDAAARAPAPTAGRRKQGAKDNEGCTPCAAMARRQAAMKKVGGLGK